jgi:hypothetical protein
MSLYILKMELRISWGDVWGRRAHESDEARAKKLCISLPYAESSSSLQKQHLSSPLL